MTISIPDDIASKLKVLADMRGQSVPGHTAHLIVEAIAKPPIDELLAPVRADFAKSGMTDDQLMNLGRHALSAVRQEKKAKSA